ncbi:MAG: TIGR00266 family protein [Clostridia bacterium]|nr:TIGR00266 family protein [Clostridia bacterium]MBQ1259253.1 TIGR00266 family protein [Clostridia bacterium]
MKYEIKGDSMPVVICRLSDGEKMITESGSMSWMSPNIQMETVGGGFGKVMGRMFSGESLFQNHFTSHGEGMIAFSSSFPGEIRVVDLTPGNDLIVQKRGFLASESSVQLSTYFQKRFASGLFGGEGFILQRLSGNGIAFIEIDGAAIEYELAAGQEIIVDTGNLAAMSSTCSMEIRTVKGAKNIIFGGEGLFLTSIKGPGKVILQTMPISNLASTISSFIPSKG